MKMSTVNTTISLFFAVLLSPQFAAAQGGHPAKPIKELIAELKSSTDTAKKNEALNLLRQSAPKTTQDKDQIIDLIEDNDMDIKCAAMDVMGKIKEKKAVKKIISNLKDKNLQVKITAAAALSEIRDERAVDPLIDDSEFMSLEFGVCPVARIGAPALSKLVQVAKADSASQEKTPKSQKAAQCISQIRDVQAIPRLKKLLKEDDEDIKLAAFNALVVMNAKEIEPEFERLLSESKNKILTRRIIRILAFSNKERYVPKIYEIMEKDPSSKFSMVGLLGELKEEAAAGKLEKLLDDEDGFVRCAASASLRRITGKIYKCRKDGFTQIEEKRLMRRINETLKQHKSGKEYLEKAIANGNVPPAQYKYLQEHPEWQDEELFKNKIIGKLWQEAQERGYLLDYGNVDEILEELKKAPEYE